MRERAAAYGGTLQAEPLPGDGWRVHTRLFLLEQARQRDLPSQGAEVMAKYAEKYLPAQRAYLAEHPPQARAHVVIDNSRWEKPAVRSWPGGPRAVLFDLWKTLVPLPEELKRRTFEATAEALGQRPEELADAWKRTREVRETRPFAEYLDWLRDQVGGAWPPDQAAEAATRRRLHGEAFATPLPGAVEAVAVARRLGLRTALVSNCTSDVRDMVRDSAFAGRFDAALLSAEAGVMKPDPELFRATADLLGVPPAACVFVGDGTDGELAGAAAAGMTAVLVECGEPRTWTGPRMASLPALTDLLITPGQVEFVWRGTGELATAVRSFDWSRADEYESVFAVRSLLMVCVHSWRT
ncbi:HAD-IA family hydrolase [Streptomyces sp. NPDC052040]|uniref:HAD-IA family hydrolase n=1 Tax=Streptomyces sp. NPDC052040 TaxID=3365682 RepID=UPI0037CF3D35